MKKYKDLGIYDFSDYAEEITGDDLFKINGGATSCSNVAPSGPSGGSGGNINQGTVKPAATTGNGQGGDSGTGNSPTGGSSTPTQGSGGPTGGNNPSGPSGPSGPSAPDISKSSEYQGVPTQYRAILAEQKAKREQKNSPVKNVYGKIESKDVKGKFVLLSVSKSKGITEVYVSRSENSQFVDKTVSFSVVTNVQSDCVDNAMPSDKDRYQGNGTNPTQVANGIYEITAARAPNSGDGKYGTGNQGLYVNVQQDLLIKDSKLKNYEEGKYIKDDGYMFHITPYKYTNGCVGFSYEINNEASKNYAISQQMYLVSLYNNCKANNQRMFVEYKD